MDGIYSPRLSQRHRIYIPERMDDQPQQEDAQQADLAAQPEPTVVDDADAEARASASEEGSADSLLNSRPSAQPHSLAQLPRSRRRMVWVWHLGSWLSQPTDHRCFCSSRALPQPERGPCRDPAPLSRRRALREGALQPAADFTPSQAAGFPYEPSAVVQW